MNYTKEQILDEIKKLYNDIDGCIDDLLDARMKNDKSKEGNAFSRMEGVMVGTLQDLTVFHDWIKQI